LLLYAVYQVLFPWKDKEDFQPLLAGRVFPTSWKKSIFRGLKLTFKKLTFWFAQLQEGVETCSTIFSVVKVRTQTFLLGKVWIKEAFSLQITSFNQPSRFPSSQTF
jgi:hypothetical protein